MELEKNIIKAQVTFPKEAREVYERAVNEGYKGYSIVTNDGRFFRWNQNLSKAEQLPKGVEVVYFDDETELVEDKAPVTTAEVKVSNYVKKEDRASKNVDAVKAKISEFKSQIQALSTSLANSTSEIKAKENLIIQLNNENATLKKSNAELSEKVKSLQADIDSILAL